MWVYHISLLWVFLLEANNKPSDMGQGGMQVAPGPFILQNLAANSVLTFLSVGYMALVPFTFFLLQVFWQLYRQYKIFYGIVCLH